MGVDYTPTMKPYEKVGAFRYWCQTTLPLVYDDSKSYLELLYSVIHYLNSTIQDVANMGDNIDALLEAYRQLQAYVNDYFNNLDVQEEIDAKLDEMASSGDLDNLLEPFVQTFVGDWLGENLTPTTPPIDRTLTVQNAGADSFTAGVNNVIQYASLYPNPVIFDGTAFTLKSGTIVSNGIRTGTVPNDLTINLADMYSTSVLYYYFEDSTLQIKTINTRVPLASTVAMIGIVYKGRAVYDARGNIAPFSKDILYTTIKPGQNTFLSKLIEVTDQSITVPANTVIYRETDTYTISSAISLLKASAPTSALVVYDINTGALAYKSYNDYGFYNGVVLGYYVKSQDVFYSEYAGIENGYITPVMNLLPRYQQFNGELFVVRAYNKLIVESMSFRLYDRFKKVYTPTLETQTLTLDSDSIRYLSFNGTAFRISTVYDDSSVAIIYRNVITPLIAHVTPYIPVYRNVYIRSGHKFYLNTERLYSDVPIYSAYTQGVDRKLTGSMYEYGSSGNRSLTYNETSWQMSIQQNNVDVSGKRYLMIGDSFVARGFIQHYLFEWAGLVSIGTRQTQNYNLMSEGVSGSRISYFTDPATSPFYFSGALNLGAYLTANNLQTPEMVIINTCINQSTADGYASNMQAIIDMVKAFDSSIPVYVAIGANYEMTEGSIYGYPALRYEAVRTCQQLAMGLENCILIPVNTALCALDYPVQNVTYFNKTVPVISDCVHPEEATGFYKIAEMIYNYLGVTS